MRISNLVFNLHFSQDLNVILVLDTIIHIMEHVLPSVPLEVFQPNKDINFQFGGYFNVSFGKFFIQPELNYVSIKNHYDFPNQQANWNTSKIDFPILIGYEVFDPVSIPQFPSSWEKSPYSRPVVHRQNQLARRLEREPALPHEFHLRTNDLYQLAVGSWSSPNVVRVCCRR